MLLDVAIEGEVDWAVPLMIVSFVLFIGALLGTRPPTAGVGVTPASSAGLGSSKEDDMSGQDEMESQPYEDPGWVPAFKRMGIGGLRGTKGVEVDGVVDTRLLFLSLLVAALLILYVLTFIIEPVGVPDPALGSVVVVFGIAGVTAAAWTANRKLNISSAAALAGSYRTNFFLGFALNEAPLLMSVVYCFIREELWPYLIALPLYLIGMALIAPSRRNLERRQEQVHRQGSTLSLGRALSSPPGQVRG